MHYRLATEQDIAVIAKLHALSWQNAYRGMLSDSYLDQEVYPERLRVWEKRLKESHRNQLVIVAEDHQKLVGFACAFGGADEHWGTLLDNLHTHPSIRRQGVGKSLMRQVAKWIVSNYGSHAMHLFVFSANKTACRFYEHINGEAHESTEIAMPDGKLVPSIKYVWETVKTILSEQ